MSTQRVCLQERLPSAATRRVQPWQLQDVEPSAYWSDWYSLSGLESELKVQTRWMGLFIGLAVEVLVFPGQAEGP